MKLEQLIDTSLLPKGTEQNGVCIPYGTIPLWFLNDDLKEDEIERQIEDFHQKGISGVMLHPRCYIPKTLEYMSERYLELFEFATECAAKRDMKVVLYDEAMYPSGSAHGAVVAENADYSARGIGFSKFSEYIPAETDVIVAYYDKDLKLTDGAPEYVIYETYSGGTARGIHEGEDDCQPNAPKSSDLLNPMAVSCFIKHTHEKYYSALKKYFGNTIIAFFTDEPSIMGRGPKKGLVAWGKGFKEYFVSNGGDINNLPILFDKTSPQYSEVYKSYKNIINKRLSESFFGQLSSWCVSHGIVLCGHPEASSDIEALGNFGIPGQDIVWRYVSPQKPLEGEHSTMGKCSSDAARHLGLKRNLNECLGCCSLTANKWDLSCSDMKWYFDWLFARGVNMLMVHAFFYSTTERRSKERPPDVGPNSAWWEHYGMISDYIKRYSYVLSECVNDTETAVLCTGSYLPYEKISAFYENQIEFNYLEENILLSSAEISDGYIKVKDYKYNKLIIEDISIFKAETVEKINALSKHGIKVIFFDDNTVDRLCDGIISPANPSIRTERIIKDGRKLLLLFNEGNEKAEISVDFENSILYYPFENKMYSFGGRLTLDIRQSAMLIEKASGDADYPSFDCVRKEYADKIHISDCFVGENLGDFSKSKPGYFGKTEYKAIFNSKKSEGALLDLGKVCEVCSVRLNGEEVGVGLWAPYTFDISGKLCDGENVLEITVTNPAANKYDEGGAKSGLIGPVCILK